MHGQKKLNGWGNVKCVDGAATTLTRITLSLEHVLGSDTIFRTAFQSAHGVTFSTLPLALTVAWMMIIPLRFERSASRDQSTF